MRAINQNGDGLNGVVMGFVASPVKTKLRNNTK